MSKAKEILAAAGAAAAAIAFFFLLSRWFSLSMVPSGVLAVALYIGVYALLKPTSRIGKVEVDHIRGGESSLELMEEAKKDIRSMEKSLPQIKDPVTAGYVTGLTQTGRRILVYLTEHPDKIDSAHRFADYYLDMAEKLVGNYLQLQKVVSLQDEKGLAVSSGGSGKAAAQASSSRSPFGIEEESTSPESVMIKTKDALNTLNTAFGNQQNRLMQGDLMEVETQIEVLRNVMKMEGDE